MSPPGGRVAFPVDESDFDKDVRVSYDREAKAFHLEDDSKTFEWNSKIKKWIEVVRSYPQQSQTYALAGRRAMGLLPELGERWEEDVSDFYYHDDRWTRILQKLG